MSGYPRGHESRASGLDADSPEVQVARQFEMKIVNSDVDPIALELEIQVISSIICLTVD